MVGKCAVGLHAVDHDLGHGIRRDQVDPLEGRDDGAFGRTQGRENRGQPDVPASLGTGAVDGLAEHGQGPLASDRCRIGKLAARSPTRLARWPPLGHVTPSRREPGRQLATDRDLDPDEVEPRHDQRRRLLEGRVLVRLAKGRPEPRSRRVAEHCNRFVPGRPFRIDPFDRGGDQAAGLGFRHRPPIRLVEQGGLEGQVHGA